MSRRLYTNAEERRKVKSSKENARARGKGGRKLRAAKWEETEVGHEVWKPMLRVRTLFSTYGKPMETPEWEGHDQICV